MDGWKLEGFPFGFRPIFRCVCWLLVSGRVVPVPKNAAFLAITKAIIGTISLDAREISQVPCSAGWELLNPLKSNEWIPKIAIPRDPITEPENGNPIPSMCGKFTYIWLFLMVKYSKCR